MVARRAGESGREQHGELLLLSARACGGKRQCTRADKIFLRAERTNPLTARYLNRLSDLLFILGRVANPGGDVLWRPGAP